MHMVHVQASGQSCAQRRVMLFTRPRGPPRAPQGGMVLTFSVWGDQGSDMSWLDVRVLCGRPARDIAVCSHRPPPAALLQAPPCDVSVNCNPSPNAALIISDLVIETH